MSPSISFTFDVGVDDVVDGLSSRDHVALKQLILKIDNTTADVDFTLDIIKELLVSLGHDVDDANKEGYNKVVKQLLDLINKQFK